MTTPLKINAELQAFFPPTTEEEDAELEASVLKSQGPLDSIKYWSLTGEIVDGYRRHKICMDYLLPYKAEPLDFEDIEEVKRWMAMNQGVRRNLSEKDRSYYRGLWYKANKKPEGRPPSTGNKLAHCEPVSPPGGNVSRATLKRDEKWADARNELAAAGVPEATLRDDKGPTKKDLVRIARDPEIEDKPTAVREVAAKKPPRNAQGRVDTSDKGYLVKCDAAVKKVNQEIGRAVRLLDSLSKEYQGSKQYVAFYARSRPHANATAEACSAWLEFLESEKGRP